MDQTSDWYSASVSVIIYVISYNIGPRYNGIRLYIEWHFTSLKFNSLAPGRCGCDSKNGIFNLVLLIGIFRSYDTVLRWMPQDFSDDKSTLVQVMAWCRQATSHYLNQCWPRSQTPYGIIKPPWVLTRYTVPSQFWEMIIECNVVLHFLE